MGILSRFTAIMKSNVYHYLDKINPPERAWKKTLRELELDLRSVQAEANALDADVKRAKREINACEAEIRKLERYRERSEERDNGKAIMFLQEQENLEAKKMKLLPPYNHLMIDLKRLRLLEEKLTMDIRALEAEAHNLREKASIVHQKEKMNDLHASVSPEFSSYEEELNVKLDEAEALIELRTGAAYTDSIEEELSRLENNHRKNT